MEYWPNTFLVPSASPSSAPTMTFCVVSSCGLRTLIDIATFAMAFSFGGVNWAPTTLWFNMWQWRSRLQNWPKILVFIVLILVFRIPVVVCTLRIILLLRMRWSVVHFCRSLKLLREIAAKDSEGRKLICEFLGHTRFEKIYHLARLGRTCIWQMRTVRV